VCLLLVLMSGNGCYLSHRLSDPPDARVDAPRRVPDAGAVDAARLDSARAFDSGRPDTGQVDSGAIDSGAIDSGTPGDAGDCVLPVEPYPERDVCRPETGACITRCGTNQACIVVCLRRDPTCQACAVRNALACFNSTPCAPLYPAASCCVVNMCALEQVDEILNICTALACGDVMQPYVDCAIADSRVRCRRAIADCGLPPTLLGF